MPKDSPAVALPFRPQLNAGDHNQVIARWCKNNTQVLALMGISFQRIFGIGVRIGLAFTVVDLPFFEDFLNLGFRNVAAAHAATGMTGINKM